MLHGNGDRNTIVAQTLSPVIVARFIRIHPVNWYGHISMRAGFQGCFIGKYHNIPGVTCCRFNHVFHVYRSEVITYTRVVKNQRYVHHFSVRNSWSKNGVENIKLTTLTL